MHNALLSEPLTPRDYLIPFLFFSFGLYYRLDGLRLDNKVTIQWELTQQPPLEAPSSDLIYIKLIAIIQT